MPCPDEPGIFLIDACRPDCRVHIPRIDHPRAKEIIQQQIALFTFRDPTVHHQDAGQSQTRAGCRGKGAQVRLARAGGDDAVGPLLQGIAHDEFQAPQFVAAGPKSCQVVPFDIYRTAGRIPQDPLQWMQRRHTGDQPDSGQIPQDRFKCPHAAPPARKDFMRAPDGSCPIPLLTPAGIIIRISHPLLAVKDSIDCSLILS